MVANVDLKKDFDAKQAENEKTFEMLQQHLLKVDNCLDQLHQQIEDLDSIILASVHIFLPNFLPPKDNQETISLMGETANKTLLLTISTDHSSMVVDGIASLI